MPELLGGAEQRAVQTCALRLASAERKLRLKGSASTLTADPHAGSLGTEAHQLGVVARPWREPLRADVERLEQVRLARAVRACNEDDAGLEPELEACVRAEVAERDLPSHERFGLSQGAGSA